MYVFGIRLVLRVIPKSYSCLPGSESQKNIIDFHPQPLYRATLCVSAVFAVARCLSVRLSVTFMYAVQTAEDIVKLLSSPGLSIFIVCFAYRAK